MDLVTPFFAEICALLREFVISLHYVLCSFHKTEVWSNDCYNQRARLIKTLYIFL